MIVDVGKNFLSLTGIRVVSRVLEFLLRVYLIRTVLTGEIVAELLGLDLIITSSLHLAKSCFKPSYQQIENPNPQHNILSSMNLMTFGVGSTIAGAAIILYVRWTTRLPYLPEAMSLYAVAAVMESLRERYAVEFVLGYQYGKLAKIELFSYLPKTLFMVFATYAGWFERYGILVFGMGQVCFYAISLLVTVFRTSYRHFLLKKLPDEPDTLYLDTKTKKVLKERVYLSAIKLLLQEFEKIVLVINQETQTSVVYSLVSGLGSIVVRFIFAPLEEIAYNYFSRGTEAESKHTFLVLVKNLTLFSVVCLSYGYAFTPTVLVFLYGDKWISEEAVSAFRWYLALLCALGLNGTMEAFLLARAHPTRTIPKFKYFSILCTGAYLASSYGLLESGFGAKGLFIGNVTGNALRIIVCWFLQIRKHISFGDFVLQIVPESIFLVFCIGSMGVVWFWEGLFQMHIFIQLTVGGFLFLVHLLPLAYIHRENLRNFFKKQKKQ